MNDAMRARIERRATIVATLKDELIKLCSWVKYLRYCCFCNGFFDGNGIQGERSVGSDVHPNEVVEALDVLGGEQFVGVHLETVGDQQIERHQP